MQSKTSTNGLDIKWILGDKMRIIIGDKSRDYMNLLGITEYPFSSQVLKDCFKKKLKEVHPDKSVLHDANDRTREVIDAYKFLKNLAVDAGEQQKEEITEKERDLFDLTVVCDKCHGTGKVPNPYYYDRIPCPYCDTDWSFNFFRFSRSSGFKTYKCNRCSGTGVFKGTFKSGVCFKCDGRGFIKVECKYCHGTGMGNNTTMFSTCSECLGKG